jgi:hypothetical protein
LKPFVWLRTASVLTLIHAALHTIGGVFGTPAPGPQQQVVAAMKSIVFPVMGVTRSYWSFHMGMGLAVSVLLAVEGVIFWQLGALAKAGVPGLRSLLMAVASQYFFAGPVINEMLIAGCLLGAILTSATQPRSQTAGIH